MSCQSGDSTAFRTLVENHQDYAYSLAIRFLGNEEDARDTVQETFIRVWKHLPSFDFRCKFTTWMYRIVINLCLDRTKSQKRREMLLQPEALENFREQCTAGIDLEDENVKKELAALITAFAAELAPRQRAVFILRDLQDESVKGVSQILGISKGAVKSNLSHARKAIRLKLEQLENNRR